MHAGTITREETTKKLNRESRMLVIEKLPRSDGLQKELFVSCSGPGLNESCCACHVCGGQKLLQDNRNKIQNDSEIVLYFDISQSR